VELEQQMAALGYVTIGAIDGKTSGAFYDALFTAFGSERKLESNGWIGYGTAGGGKTFMDCHTAVCPPFDGKEARAGNGIMIAYRAPSPEAVKAAYAAAMKNGGKDEGGPGFRPPDAKQGFYAAYLRDPTGNKLCVFAVV
jgi:catechol 2,3-dioxygenase-like lactoylglutathione lyase family enzyme